MQSTTAGPRPLFRRIADVFVAPRRLAAELRQHAPLVGALALTTLVAVLAAAALPEDFFLQRTENPVNRLGRPVEVTSSPEEIVRWGRYLQMFSALVEHPVIVFTVAGLVTLIFSVIGGGQVSMRQYLSLTAHAFAVSALGVLLTVAWQRVSGDADAHLSLALLSGGSAEGPRTGLVGMLELVNPFTLWTLAVLAIGVSELDSRRSLPAAAGVLLGLYLLLVVAVASIG